MKYSIKQFAQLSNVTTRTLRYYDEIGILTPAFIDRNGYRYYDHENLLRLQQILFFRELDVPLKEIQDILTRPEFDLEEALQKHRSALESRAKRIFILIETIDQTIATLQGEWIMSEKDYFEGFDESKYTEEAQQRWGSSPQFAESQRKWGSYSKQKKEELMQKSQELMTRLVGSDSNLSPSDAAIQAAVAEYHAYVNEYFYTCDLDNLRGLADLWENDPRFAANFEKIRQGGAGFVKKAVLFYCDNQ